MKEKVMKCGISRRDYKKLQQQLSQKLYTYCGSKWSEGYNEGISVAKSILHSFFVEFKEKSNETCGI